MFMTICLKCGRIEYSLRMGNNIQKLMQMIQRSVEKGAHWCPSCNSHQIKFSQIKWKDYQLLLKKFPNKTVVSSKKSIEQLLAMEGEWITSSLPTDPDLER